MSCPKNKQKQHPPINGMYFLPSVSKEESGGAASVNFQVPDLEPDP